MPNDDMISYIATPGITLLIYSLQDIRTETFATAIFQSRSLMSTRTLELIVLMWFCSATILHSYEAVCALLAQSVEQGAPMHEP